MQSIIKQKSHLKNHLQETCFSNQLQRKIFHFLSTLVLHSYLVVQWNLFHSSPFTSHFPHISFPALGPLKFLIIISSKIPFISFFYFFAFLHSSYRIQNCFLFLVLFHLFFFLSFCGGLHKNASNRRFFSSLLVSEQRMKYVGWC